MEHDNFKSFCSAMHQECKLERRQHGEKEISYNEYVVRNKTLLLKLYAEQETNERRKRMDG